MDVVYCARYSPILRKSGSFCSPRSPGSMACRACRAWLLILLLLLCHGAGAQTPRKLTATADPIDLAPHMAWLRDTTGAMTIEQVAASPAWQALPGNLNMGFTHDAIWLRVAIDRPADGPRDWLLEINNAVFAEVRLYQASAGAGWRERRAGGDVPRSEWDWDFRVPVFRLHVDEPGPHTFWLRIRSRTSISAQVVLWQPAAFQARANTESLAYGILFGAYAAIFIFHLLFWTWTREEVNRWYAGYVACSIGQMLLNFGHLQQYTGMPGPLGDRLLALLICSSIWFGVKLCVQFLGLATLMPRLARILPALALVLAVVTSFLAVDVGYAAGVAPAQMSILVLIGILTAIGLRLWLRGHRHAGFFLLAFGIYFAGIVLRILRNLTVLPPNLLTDNCYQVGAIAHMAVMSLAITWRYNALKQENARVQAEALRVQTDYALSLESTVTSRTASLVAEIRRREAVEGELRLALEAEKRARQEQCDFVAMVSHEFRTPLSIIDTSAQRIAGSAGTPQLTMDRSGNIRQAVRRMTSLMDALLSLDPLDNALRAFALANVDPEPLLRSVAREWDGDTVVVTCSALPGAFPCDPELMRLALRNLLSNAIRHSPQDSPVHLGAVGGDNGIAISITDRGHGIPSDELPKLFQKYFRGRRAAGKPGTGLGLYLVKRVIDLHQGSIRVDSQLGHGTTFVISLPHATAGPARPSAAADNLLLTSG
ncbi:sensor histidine kinase [Cupriavidus sp. USMAHM13]|uniref:sensor histidine kinase n=1 Tax=Cupriavidus sp. USMAHM13 TaxID=1389192 RepID=UPI0009F6E4C5|nr:sensor histidine kinase [Cupriavidus sp. USMAHM13]